jgi:septum site-determining protein MinC
LKTKQHSVKVVEIDLIDEDEFISFFDKNYQFFQNNFISINGQDSEKIKNYLDSRSLKYGFNLTFPSQKKAKEIIYKDTSKKTEDKQEKKLTVIDKLVRSGQEISVEGDLLLLNRINSGGSIVINGTLIATQTIDGCIRCNGDFMLIQTSNKANIVFHGVEVDNKLLQDKLNRVELKNDEIFITPALKERSWV